MYSPLALSKFQFQSTIKQLMSSHAEYNQICKWICQCVIRSYNNIEMEKHDDRLIPQSLPCLIDFCIALLSL